MILSSVKTNRYAELNLLLRCIESRKRLLSTLHSKSPNKHSLDHRVANDPCLSLLYIDAEKELSRLFTITYDPSGRIQINKNPI